MIGPCEVDVAAFDLVEVVRRKRIEHVPHARACEAVDLLDPELRCRTRRVLHPLGGTLTYAFRLAVTPYIRRDDRAVSLVDRIAYALADEMSADRKHLQPVFFEQPALRPDVTRVVQRSVHLEMIAPTRQLEPVEAPAARLGGELGQRQVGPLSREEGDGPCHRQAAARTGTARPAAPRFEVTGS
jgi:hypothetical protein